MTKNAGHAVKSRHVVWDRIAIGTAIATAAPPRVLGRAIDRRRLGALPEKLSIFVFCIVVGIVLNPKILVAFFSAFGSAKSKN